MTIKRIFVFLLVGVMVAGFVAFFASRSFGAEQGEAKTGGVQVSIDANGEVIKCDQHIFDDRKGHLSFNVSMDDSGEYAIMFFRDIASTDASLLEDFFTPFGSSGRTVYFRFRNDVITDDFPIHYAKTESTFDGAREFFSVKVNEVLLRDLLSFDDAARVRVRGDNGTLDFEIDQVVIQMLRSGLGQRCLNRST